MGIRSIPLCLLLLLSVVHFHLAATTPKVGNENSKQDQKWPNFFNPKQSILRDTRDKDDEKLEQKYSKESHSTNEENGPDENVEELIDYTLKGGLRGTYVLLNGTNSNLEYLPKEAQVSIRKILEGNALEEMSNKESRNEKTEEGLRLRTPLVTKLRTKSMGKYGAHISYFATDTSQDFIYFGNWCGKGGRSGPVDNIDACCLEHEKCYGRQIRQCPDVWQKPYSNMYGWALLKEKHPVCVRSESLCVNHVCNCDLEAALCFDHYLHHPAEITLNLVESPPPEELALEEDSSEGPDSGKLIEEDEEEE